MFLTLTAATTYSVETKTTECGHETYFSSRNKGNSVKFNLKLQGLYQLDIVAFLCTNGYQVRVKTGSDPSNKYQYTKIVFNDSQPVWMENALLILLVQKPVVEQSIACEEISIHISNIFCFNSNYSQNTKLEIIKNKQIKIIPPL